MEDYKNAQKELTEAVKVKKSTERNASSGKRLYGHRRYCQCQIHVSAVWMRKAVILPEVTMAGALVILQMASMTSALENIITAGLSDASTDKMVFFNEIAVYEKSWILQLHYQKPRNMSKMFPTDETEEKN